MKRKSFNKALGPLLLILFSIFINQSRAAGTNPPGINAACSHELLKELSVLDVKSKNIILNSFSGNVTVTGDEVSDMSVKVYGSKEQKDIFDLQYSYDADNIRIESSDISERTDGNQFDELSFEVTLPKDIYLNIKTGSGDVAVSEIFRKTKIFTGGGDITAKNIYDNIYAVSGGGNIKVDNIKGEVNLITTGGNIKAIDFSQTLVALTDVGDIFLKGSDAAINAYTGAGGITIDYFGQNKGMVLSATSGNIKLDVPANFGADLNLLAEDGRIKGDIDVSKDKNFVKSPLNGGGKKLYCMAHTGNITLTRKKNI